MWKKVGAELVEMNMVDRVDLVALERLCVAYDRLTEAEDILADEGTVLQSENGGAYLHPAFAAMRSAENQIQTYITMLGLTRKARIDLVVAKDSKRAVSSRNRTRGSKPQ